MQFNCKILVLIAIEIKYSAAPKLNHGNTLAFQKINAENNIVIIPKGENYPLWDNIEVYNLQDFINKGLK